MLHGIHKREVQIAKFKKICCDEIDNSYKMHTSHIPLRSASSIKSWSKLANCNGKQIISFKTVLITPLDDV